MPDWITTKADRDRYRAANRAADYMSDAELSRAWDIALNCGDDVRAAAYESHWDWRNA